MEYQGFKSQALDFNVYSDGVSVSSVTKQYALAPVTTGNKPLTNIDEGGVTWSMVWLDSPPPYADYPTGKDAGGNDVLITNKGKNAYWERQVTYYSNDPDKPFPGDASKSTMLDVDFINALGITAKKITVLQDNEAASNPNTNPILFEADGYNQKGEVKIGGFVVDANSLAAGTAGTTTGIKLTSGKTGTDKVIEAGTKFNVDANGNIEAEGGTIGGWTISETELSAEKASDSKVKVGLSVPQDGVDDDENYVIWAGGENGTKSPFSVALDGTISINKGGLNLSTDAEVEKSTEGFLGIGKGEQINRATFVTQPAKSILVNNRRDEGSIPDYWVNTVCYGVRGVPDYVRGGTMDVEDEDADGNTQTFFTGGLTISSDSYTVHSDATPDVGEAYIGKTSVKTAFIQAQANSRYQSYDSSAKLVVGEWNRPIQKLTDADGVIIDKEQVYEIPSPAALDAVYITPYTISGSNLGIIGESQDFTQALNDTYTKRRITGAQDSVVGMCFRSGGGYYSDDWPWAIWAGNESTWGTKAFRVGHSGEVYIKDSLTYKGATAYSLRYHIFTNVPSGEEYSYNTGATVIAAVACRKQTKANSKNYAWSVNWGGTTIYATNKSGGSDDLVVFYLV